MRIIKKMVLIVTALAMLFVWPIHPFRELTSVRSGDIGHELTEPLAVGESLTQYFKTPDNNLVSLEYVLTCDDSLPMAGTLSFQLLDEQETVIFEQILDYSQVPDYSYGAVVTNLRVKKGRLYAYRITNLSVTENMPCGVYTRESSARCLKKGSLVCNENVVDGELLTRVTTNSPIPWENTLAIWGCLAMVGFSVYELLDRRDANS